MCVCMYIHMRRIYLHLESPVNKELNNIMGKLTSNDIKYTQSEVVNYFIAVGLLNSGIYDAGLLELTKDSNVLKVLNKEEHE